MFAVMKHQSCKILSRSINRCAEFWHPKSFKTHGSITQIDQPGLYLIISLAPEATRPKQRSPLCFVNAALNLVGTAASAITDATINQPIQALFTHLQEFARRWRLAFSAMSSLGHETHILLN